MKNAMRKLRHLLLAAVIASAVTASFAAHAEEARAGVSDETVNINTATVDELSFLPGVGPSKAQAIVDFRAKHPFKKVDEILKVKGIGRKSFQALRPHLAVEGPTTAKGKIKLQKAADSKQS